MAEVKVTLIIEDSKTKRTRSYYNIQDVIIKDDVEHVDPFPFSELGPRSPRNYTGTITINVRGNGAALPYTELVENLPRVCKHCGLPIEAITEGEGRNSRIARWIHTATMVQRCTSPLAEPID